VTGVRTGVRDHLLRSFVSIVGDNRCPRHRHSVSRPLPPRRRSSPPRPKACRRRRGRAAHWRCRRPSTCRRRTRRIDSHIANRVFGIIAHRDDCVCARLARRLPRRSCRVVCLSLPAHRREHPAEATLEGVIIAVTVKMSAPSPPLIVLDIADRGVFGDARPSRRIAEPLSVTRRRRRQLVAIVGGVDAITPSRTSAPPPPRRTLSLSSPVNVSPTLPPLMFSMLRIVSSARPPTLR